MVAWQTRDALCWAVQSDRACQCQTGGWPLHGRTPHNNTHVHKIAPALRNITCICSPCCRQPLGPFVLPLRHGRTTAPPVLRHHRGVPRSWLWSGRHGPHLAIASLAWWSAQTRSLHSCALALCAHGGNCCREPTAALDPVGHLLRPCDARVGPESTQASQPPETKGMHTHASCRKPDWTGCHSWARTPPRTGRARGGRKSPLGACPRRCGGSDRRREGRLRGRRRRGSRGGPTAPRGACAPQGDRREARNASRGRAAGVGWARRWRGRG